MDRVMIIHTEPLSISRRGAVAGPSIAAGASRERAVSEDVDHPHPVPPAAVATLALTQHQRRDRTASLTALLEQPGAEDVVGRPLQMARQRLDGTRVA
ncbi:hypothetical protein GCM10009776_14010 [Microbacterium deminutum]|uniref:Uncharacterized protein n=1 Tax=Microbacterium deminutum TaxID=344164 RepID=A0ABP5BVH9_9MICO